MNPIDRLAGTTAARPKSPYSHLFVADNAYECWENRHDQNRLITRPGPRLSMTTSRISEIFREHPARAVYTLYAGDRAYEWLRSNVQDQEHELAVLNTIPVRQRPETADGALELERDGKIVWRRVVA